MCAAFLPGPGARGGRDHHYPDGMPGGNAYLAQEQERASDFDEVGFRASIVASVFRSTE